SSDLSCPHCGGYTSRGRCAAPWWHRERAKKQRERGKDRGRIERRPPTLAIDFQSWGDSLNIRGIRRKARIRRRGISWQIRQRPRVPKRRLRALDDVAACAARC